MKQVIQDLRSGRLEIADVPSPALRQGGVLVRNSASLISAGTERMVIEFGARSLIGKAQDRPDLVRQVIDKARSEGIGPTLDAVRSRLGRPTPLGYSCAGVVVAVGDGAGEFSPGDRVACAGAGYAVHAEMVFVPRNLVVPIPTGVSFEDAAYVTLGAIALHGVRTAEPRLGDRVAVIGLGLLGLLAVQILRAGGCRVLGVDLDPARVQLARELGAEAAVTRADDVAAAAAAFTAGRGVDAVLITAATDSNDPIELAGEIARDRAIVTVVGAVRLDVPREAFYERELQLRLSRSYGPGRYDPSYEEAGIDYPIGYVRWTERHNLEEFLHLLADGRVRTARLTTHRFPIAAAANAYALVTSAHTEPFTGIVLTYPDTAPPPSSTIELNPAPPRGQQLGIACLGAGAFAQSVLLPTLRRVADATPVVIASEGGLSARTAALRYGFARATTDPEVALQDPLVDAVIIATRHDSHAPLAARALTAGKAVFLEKPLAIDEAGLRTVVAAQQQSGQLLTVGFNRRFSPLAVELKHAFGTGTPLALNYRVNAGPIPADHWVHDPARGGGRIIGEVCHFIDLCQFLTDELPVEVFAQHGGPHPARHDTVTLLVRFQAGSLASICYFSEGDRSFGKERIEVFGGGTAGVLDDFRELRVRHDGRQRRVRARSQQKGFDQELNAFLDAVRTGGPPPIPLASLVATTRATFAAELALQTGRPVPVPINLPDPPTSG